MFSTEFDRPLYSLADANTPVSREVELPAWVILPLLTTGVTVFYWWFFDHEGPTQVNKRNDPDPQA